MNKQLHPNPTWHRQSRSTAGFIATERNCTNILCVNYIWSQGRACFSHLLMPADIRLLLSKSHGAFCTRLDLFRTIWAKPSCTTLLLDWSYFEEPCIYLSDPPVWAEHGDVEALLFKVPSKSDTAAQPSAHRSTQLCGHMLRRETIADFKVKLCGVWSKGYIKSKAEFKLENRSLSGHTLYDQ